MIPILYETTETAFANNGLGRLRDCISCTVTEERNGIYECDFEYPVTGANFDLIQLGRIVAVTHDDTGDIQPFDIVSYEKPIDGVVSFHCVHVSYRQSYMTMGKTSGWGNKPNGGSTVGWQLPINSLEDALTMITASSPPTNPFSYFTDKTSSGYLACADGTPRTVRQILGGIEGSILDTYGGEYLFDKWTVSLLSSRGQYRDFTIRYGVNMLDYKDETDSEGTYSNCIPYWTDGTEFVVGDMQSSGTTITGRGECVPLDVSDKFENKPTKAAVESMGESAMNGNNPVQSITVSFVRLQDTEEYAGFQNLLTCRLCDTIRVIFPEYNTQGDFKIVKTVWNVLTGKYDEMELGELSTTLSEALGISNTLDRTGGGSTPTPTIEPFIKSATFTATPSVPATGWYTKGSIPFTVPAGYTALPGVVVQNSGYITIYQNGWGQGATSAAFRAYNRSSSAVQTTYTARVTFIKSEYINP